MQARSFKPFRLDYTLEALERLFIDELRTNALLVQKSIEAQKY